MTRLATILLFCTLAVFAQTNFVCTVKTTPFVIEVSDSLTGKWDMATNVTLTFTATVPNNRPVRFLRATPVVALQWAASTNADVIGYKIYSGLRRNTYTRVFDAGADHTALVPLICPPQYFALTTYDGYGVESDFSGERAIGVFTPITSLNQNR